MDLRFDDRISWKRKGLKMPVGSFPENLEGNMQTTKNSLHFANSIATLKLFFSRNVTNNPNLCGRYEI